MRKLLSAGTLHRIILLPGILTLLSCTHLNAQLSANERALTDYVDAHLEASIRLLTNSVNINSGTLNIEGVRKVGELFAHELQQLGFTTEWVNEPDSLHRAGHLVATHHGKA
jgi:glutamate carboxypeptidase